jgi:hypothetical protein
LFLLADSVNNASPCQCITYFSVEKSDDHVYIKQE